MPARHDLATDPDVVAALATVRAGTAFFRRAVDRLSDAELDAPSLLPGWSRRHVLAHVGYNARAVARLVTWGATGVETPMYASKEARGAEIEMGATLNAEALRNLVDHSAIDLDVRWRDLPADRWDAIVVTAQGREVPVAETVWMRTREVWLHAVDLADGARLEQVPAPVLRRLLQDVHGAWSRRGIDVPAIQVADETESLDLGDRETAELVVSGPLAALTGWATGRLGAHERDEVLTWTKGTPQPAPSWI